MLTTIQSVGTVIPLTITMGELVALFVAVVIAEMTVAKWLINGIKRLVRWIKNRKK